MSRILVIEDDPAISSGLKALLNSVNYEVFNSADGKEGLQKALQTNPDLILLDINLPSLDGFEVCRKLRENKYYNPVIMLTSYSGQVDKIVGLEIGADDYITKPFDNREVLARIKARLRQLKTTEAGDQKHEMQSSFQRKLLTVMLTDIQDYSKAMNNNEQLALRMLEAHNRIMRDCIKNNKGEIIEITGDAFLVSFNSTLDAVMCAVSIQKEFKKFNYDKTDEEKIKIRIGIHLGDVVEFEGKLKGDVINIAARIQQNAVAGDVCFSETVYSTIKNKTKLKINNLGKHPVKNIGEPLAIFSINIE